MVDSRGAQEDHKGERVSRLRDELNLIDCQRIVSVAASHGLYLTLREAEDAWSEFSDMMSAGWCCLPDDDAEI